MTATNAATETSQETGAVQALGIDILHGLSAMVGARRQLDAIFSDRGATWSRALALGGFGKRLPVAQPRLGIMLLSGWPSMEQRTAFREGAGFRSVTDATRTASLDLGAGMARSEYANVILNHDGWLDLLPVGKAPRGPTAVLTYTRVNPKALWAFQRLSRAIALSARQTEGYLGSSFGTAFNAPLMRVMSLTLWDRRASASEWAYNGDTHPRAITWLIDVPSRMPGGFVARFPILKASGTLDGVDLAAALARASGARGG